MPILEIASAVLLIAGIFYKDGFCITLGLMFAFSGIMERIIKR